MTNISGVNFRPKICWAKVVQKSYEPKTRKNMFFYEMLISYVIVVVEKNAICFEN